MTDVCEWQRGTKVRILWPWGHVRKFFDSSQWGRGGVVVFGQPTEVFGAISHLRVIFRSRTPSLKVSGTSECPGASLIAGLSWTAVEILILASCTIPKKKNSISVISTRPVWCTPRRIPRNQNFTEYPHH